MKHFGIRNRSTGAWLMDANGMVFWTTSRAVAEIQLEHGLFLTDEIKGAGWRVDQFPIDQIDERTLVSGASPTRVLLKSDPYCPSCGHNRDKSAVSSVDCGDDIHYCQKCQAYWKEP